jgi:hypothetical protein
MIIKLVHFLDLLPLINTSSAINEKYRHEIDLLQRRVQYI